MKGALAKQQFPGPTDLLDGVQVFLDEVQKYESEPFTTESSEFDGCWIMTETTSMNKPSILTIHSSSALVCLRPLLIHSL
jgi:hypothetical protein